MELTATRLWGQSDWLEAVDLVRRELGVFDAGAPAEGAPGDSVDMLLMRASAMLSEAAAARRGGRA